MSKIYVLLEHSGGQIKNVAREGLVLGQQISERSGKTLHALLVGFRCRQAAEQASRLGVQSVLLVDHPELQEYDPDRHCQTLREILEEDRPDILLASHTYQNIDLMPKLAAALNVGLVTECIGFEIRNGETTFVRQMFRSRLNAQVRISSPHPWIITLQAGAWSADELETGNGQIEERVVKVPAEMGRKPLEVVRAGKGTVDLAKAEVIVGVGRGIKSADNLKWIRELAQVLGAEIGASRPVVDNEWLERERQIGSSGQNVSPRLYIACGISGAIQHLVGMKSSNCIVAINTDPNAPIFNVSNYGIVGDLAEVVPALTRKLKESLES